MDRQDFLSWVGRNGAVIASAVAEAPDCPVPSCPGWKLRDLAFHVGCVLSLWADVVRRASLEVRPMGHGLERPIDADLERFVRREIDEAVSVLSTSSSATPAWNWWGDPTARLVPRVLAHETSIHAWDATNALGRPSTIDASVAADGIIGFFDIWIPYSGKPPSSLLGTIAFDATDLGVSWLVDVGGHGLPTVTATTASTSAVVVARGAAAELLLLLWRRHSPDAVTVIGDRAFLERFLAYPNLKTD